MQNAAAVSGPACKEAPYAHPMLIKRQSYGSKRHKKPERPGEQRDSKRVNKQNIQDHKHYKGR